MKLLFIQLILAVIKKMGIYYRYLYCKGRAYQKKYLGLMGQKKIFFMMTPTYGNLGDQAIEFATNKFLEDYFSEYTIVKVHLEDIYIEMAAIEFIYEKNDFVVLQGGGNFGDLYYECELARQFIVEHLKEAKVVVFPSTLTYTDSKQGNRLLKRAKKIYNSNSNLLILSREKYSYDFGKKEFALCENYLVPDIVHYLCESQCLSERAGVLVCLRQDSEQITDQRNLIITEICQQHVVELYDTQLYRKIDDDIKQYEIESALRTFRRAEVVVTDRLHGLIFSVITNTPCIVLPSFDKKIEGTYEWHKKLNFIKFVKNQDMQEILNAIMELKSVKLKNHIDYKKKYFLDLFLKIYEVVR